jgi:hypothetical protein
MDSVMKQKRIIKSVVVVIALILIIILPGSLYFTDVRIAMMIAAIIWFFLDKTDMEYLWYSAIFFLFFDQFASFGYTHFAPFNLYLIGEAIFGASFDLIIMSIVVFLAFMSLVFFVFAWIQNFRVISQNTVVLVSLILVLFIFSLGAGIEGFLMSPLYGLTIFLGRKIEKSSQNKTGELLLMHFLIIILLATDIHYYRVNVKMRIILCLIIVIIYLTYGLLRTEKNQEKVFKGILVFQGLVSLGLIVIVFIDKSGFLKPLPVISLLAQYFAIQLIYLFSPDIIRKDRPKPIKAIKNGES